MVNRLIKLTVETGCACAISAVLELGFFLGIPSTNIHLIVWVSLKHLDWSCSDEALTLSALVLSKSKILTPVTDMGRRH